MSTSVFAPKRFFRLISSDAVNISRDPTLLFATLLSVVPTIIAATLWTTANAAVEAQFGLAGFMGYMVPFISCLPPLLIGWVTGFLFLEDRDDGPLMALDVTPVGKAGFFAYRVSVTAFIAAAITLLAWFLLLAESGLGMAILLMVLVALEAVAAALVLPAIARNKVEGLALTKVTNLLSVAPLIAIVPSPWRYLAAPIPTYWVGELLHISGVDYLPFWLVAAIALVTHAAAAWGAFRLAINRVG